jgi:hypothetical protein
MTDEFMKVIPGEAPLCTSNTNARMKGTFFVEHLAMLCTLKEDLRGRNGGHRQAAHAQSTREMVISSLLALAWELKPTADLGPAWACFPPTHMSGEAIFVAVLMALPHVIVQTPGPFPVGPVIPYTASRSARSSQKGS